MRGAVLLQTLRELLARRFAGAARVSRPPTGAAQMPRLYERAALA